MGESIQVRYRIKAPVNLAVDLQVSGFTTLLGRSGTGKTTLLKALAGLVPAQGTPFSGLPPRRRPVAYMPQGLALFPHLSALDNVAFPLLSLPREERMRRARDLLGQMGLADKLHHYPQQLSWGQGQRVALARALAVEPQLLLLDEPTSALDAITREEVMRDVVTRIRAARIPTLAVSHDPALAMHGDHLAILADGKILQQGPPDQVLSSPATKAVAELVGFRNLFPATIKDVAGSWLRLDTELGTLLAARQPGFEVGQEIVWGIRPENGRVFSANEPIGGAENVFKLRLGRVYRQSGGVELTFAVPAGLTLIVPPPTWELIRLDATRSINVALGPSYLHLMAS